jgi:hypothetical protein
VKRPKITLCSDSNTHFSYSDHLDRYPIPPKTHMVTPPSQSVSFISACYIALVGHFHEEHEDPGRVDLLRCAGGSKVQDVLERRSLSNMKAKQQTQLTQLRTSERQIDLKIHKMPRRGRQAGKKDIGGLVQELIIAWHVHKTQTKLPRHSYKQELEI